MGRRGPKPGKDRKYGSKGATLSARITVATRQRLEAAAKANKLSLSQELEARLVATFEQDVPGYATNRSLLTLLRKAVDRADEFTGQHWLRDPYTFDLMAKILALLIHAFRPAGDARLPVTAEPVRSAWSVIVDDAAREKALEGLNEMFLPDLVARSLALEILQILSGVKPARGEDVALYDIARDLLDGALSDRHLLFGQSGLINESMTVDGKPGLFVSAPLSLWPLKKRQTDQQD